MGTTEPSEDDFDWVGLLIGLAPFVTLIAFLIFDVWGPAEWLVDFPLT